jgi:hypothetical protein
MFMLDEMKVRDEDFGSNWLNLDCFMNGVFIVRGVFIHCEKENYHGMYGMVWHWRKTSLWIEEQACMGWLDNNNELRALALWQRNKQSAHLHYMKRDELGMRALAYFGAIGSDLQNGGSGKESATERGLASACSCWGICKKKNKAKHVTRKRI